LGGMALLAFYYLSNPPFIGFGHPSMVEGNYLIVIKESTL